MKKLLISFLIALTILLVGCSMIKDKRDQLESYESESTIYARYKNQVLDCLEAGDREGLTALFSENVRNSDNFDEEIDELFKIWGDYAISDRDSVPTYSGPRNRAWDYGEYTYDVLGFEFGPFDLGEIDYMSMYVCVANSDEENIGLLQICLIHDIFLEADEIVFTIGEIEY